MAEREESARAGPRESAGGNAQARALRHPKGASTYTLVHSQGSSYGSRTRPKSAASAQSSQRSNTEADEALSWALEQNKSTIAALKQENKELRDRKRQTVTSSESEQMEQLHSRVQSLRRQLDAAKQTTMRLRKEARMKRDKAKELEKASEKPDQEDNELTRRIASLEQKLRQMTEKHTEAQTAKKTYEQLLRRLKDEHVGSDDQLASLDQRLTSKSQTLSEMGVQFHGTHHSRDASMRLLDDAGSKLEQQREQQERELRQLTKQVSAKREAVEKLEQQVHRLAPSAVLSNGYDYSEAEQQQQQQQQQQLLTAPPIHRGTYSSGATETSYGSAEDDSPASPSDAGSESGLFATRNRRISVIDEAEGENALFERTFEQISQQLDISEPEQLIGKLTAQENSCAHLTELSKEAAEKVERLQKERDEKKAEVDELRYSTEEAPSAAKSRKGLEEAENALNDAKQQVARAKERHERAASELVKLRAGVSHLAERLGVSREDGPESLLQACEQTFMELSELAKDAPSSPPATMLEQALPQSNFRVSLTGHADGASDDDLDDEEDDDVLDDEDDEHERGRSGSASASLSHSRSLKYTPRGRTGGSLVGAKAMNKRNNQQHGKESPRGDSVNRSPSGSKVQSAPTGAAANSIANKVTGPSSTAGRSNFA